MKKYGKKYVLVNKNIQLVVLVMATNQNFLLVAVCHGYQLKNTVGSQTWKKPFFVNSEILGIQIWRKSCGNDDKFEMATKQRELNIEPNCVLFLPFDM